MAIGYQAGQTGQNSSAVAIGNRAGASTQGINSIAIGAGAGTLSQHGNTIVISATGVDLNTLQTNSCYIAPIRELIGTANSVMTYNPTNFELRYSSNLTLSGSIAASTYYSSSDSRLKENIRPFPPVLDKLTRIDPVLFDWKADGRKDYGFIAQQFFHEMDFLKEAHKYEGVEFPTDANGKDLFYSMEYPKITAILCKAIQELNDKIVIIAKNK